MPWPAVDDRDRDPRSLRRRERYVVVAVRKRRTTEICADIDHFVSQFDVSGHRVWPEAGDGHGVREHFGEHKTRFVSHYIIYLSYFLRFRLY